MICHCWLFNEKTKLCAKPVLHMKTLYKKSLEKVQKVKIASRNFFPSFYSQDQFTVDLYILKRGSFFNFMCCVTGFVQ